MACKNEWQIRKKQGMIELEIKRLEDWFGTFILILIKKRT